MVIGGYEMMTANGGSIGGGAVPSSYADDHNFDSTNFNSNSRIGRKDVDGEESEGSDDYKPPPPRDDYFFDDDVDVDDNYIHDNDNEYSQIGGTLTNNNIDDSFLHVHDGNNDSEQIRRLVNDSSMFGEDTMRILLHAESRLRTIAPSLPPPSTKSSSSSSSSSSQSILLRDCSDEVVVATTASEEEYRTDGDGAKTGYDYYGHDDEDDDDGSMSEGVASLLRGPIMAARSVVMTASYSPASSIVVGGVYNQTTVTTPLSTTEQQQQQQQKKKQQPKSSVDDTPHTARERSPSSPRLGQTQQQQQQKKQQPKSSVVETPHTARERSPSSPQVQQHLLHPSVQKRQSQQQQHTSPHDSVSTMGQRSPSEGYNGSNNNVVDGGENSVGKNVGGRTRVIFDMVDTALNNEERKGRDISKPTSTSDVAGIPNTKDNGGVWMENMGVSASSSSLDGRIALGEEQMMRSGTMNNTTMVVAAVMNSNRVSNEMQQQQQSKHMAKKPFLRKGTRKEPSALQTFTTTATAPVTSIGSVGLTPSTFRRQQQQSPAAATDAATVNDNANNVNETLSERLARLARLEKMQEDQIKDLERRQARKEEARRERRRLMTTNSSSNNRKVTTPTAVSTSSPATTKSAITPNRHVVSTPSTKQNASCMSVVNVQTPSQMRQSECDMTPSQVRAADPKQQTPVIVEEISTIESIEINDIDVITPSQARRNMFSSVSTMKKATVDEIVNKYISDGGIIVKEDDENNTAKMCVEGKEVIFQASSVNGGGKENETNQRNQAVTTTLATAKMGTKPKFTMEKKAGSKSAPRLRSTTTRVVSGTRSSSTTRMQNDAKKSPLMSNINDDERKAFEEWKKKEEEQWALIKNMKKRQEVALREAEGERERAKAWATTEKESVQKWATEQRALIKRDRHKAANMALVSSKAANKLRLQQQEDDTGNAPKQNVVQVELEELRLQLKKSIEKDTAEIQKLKEVILKQERAIEVLKCGKENDIEEGLTVSNPTRSSKSAVGGHTEPRQGLQVREPIAGTSKQNTSRVQMKSKSKLPQQRKATNVINGSTKNGNVGVEEASLCKEGDSASEEGDEPTELWLQRNISKLHVANNESVAKMNEHSGNDIQDGRLVISNEMDMQQRRSYNAADYDGSTNHEPLKTTTSNHHSEPSVPSYVTTTISTPNPPPINAATAAAVLVDGGVGGVLSTKSRIMTYKNGTQKEVTPDGTTTISFANGDRKRTYANEKKGVIVYYYASTKTTQVTHQDGMQTYHFPNKQVENHHTDGRKEIMYPDGTIRLVDIDGTTDTTFPDGVRVVDYPNGTQRVIQG